MRLRYSTAAQVHIAHIHDYINERNPAAATRVAARIRDAAERLVENPFMGRAGVISGTREWVVRGLPYIIVYEVHADREELVVLGVYHGAQLRPGQIGGDP